MDNSKRIEFWKTSQGTDIVEICNGVVRQVGVLWVGVPNE
jgi:hypothetical protein